MAFSTGHSSNTFEEYMDKEVDIIAKYLGITKIPCLIQSPLRKDNKPSFGIYSPDGKRVYWKDFATNEKGGLYDLLSRLWKCPVREVIDKIAEESFTNIVERKNKQSVYKIPVYVSKDSKLECKVREWRKYDIDYWESYGISLKWLKYAEVYPISHKIIIKGNNRYVLGADKYAYVFVEHKENKVTLKIYQPFNKNGYKWSNKHDRSVLSLWTKVPKEGDKLVICSSLKDALCLWANTGIPAIAVQGEGYTISNTAINNLKSRYKTIYILFDNDEAGLKDGEKLSKLTGFTNIVLPQFNGGKDISDAYKALGKLQFKAIIKPLLDN